MISRKEDLVTLASDSKKLPNFIWGTILVLIFIGKEREEYYRVQFEERECHRL